MGTMPTANRQRQAIAARVLLALIPAGVLGAILWLYFPRRFNSEGWKLGARGPMVRDLVRSRRLNGLTYEEVLQLLGKPDFGEAPPKSPEVDWVYQMPQTWSFTHYDLHVSFAGDPPRVAGYGLDD